MDYNGTLLDGTMVAIKLFSNLVILMEDLDRQQVLCVYLDNDHHHHKQLVYSPSYYYWGD